MGTTREEVAAAEARLGRVFPDLFRAFLEHGANGELDERDAVLPPAELLRGEDHLVGYYDLEEAGLIGSIGQFVLFTDDGLGNYHALRFEEDGVVSVYWVDHETGSCRWPSVEAFLAGAPPAPVPGDGAD